MYLLLCDSGQRFGFDPFGEVTHCYDNELALALSNGQRSQYVQPPLLERLGACDPCQWLGWEVRDVGVLLENFAFPD